MKYLIFCVFLLGCFQETMSPKITFSKTQEWRKLDLHFLKYWEPLYISFTKKELGSLSHFPLEKSRKFIKEKSDLLALERTRVKDDEEKILFQKHICGFFYSGYRFGFNTSFDDHLMDAYMDTRLFALRAKKHFNRARPSFVVKELKPLIENPSRPSYPSHHSIQARLIGLILSEVFPEKKSVISSAEKEIIKNRELSGVSYPSDSELGKNIADMSFDKLMSNKFYFDKLEFFKKKKNQLILRIDKFSKKDYDQCLKYTNDYANRKGVW